jgi:radical SAM superfamily enzyme YgiQ (UPF0313 family)
VKNNTDIVLINPKNKKFPSPYGLIPPLGLTSIGCLLEKNGFSVKILDLEIKPDSFDLSKYIRNHSPRIIGISGTSQTRFESFIIADIAKQISPEIITVYGGCHATCTAANTLSHIKAIDFIVRGEGEITFLELVNYLASKKGDLTNIKGISFLKNSRVVHNRPRERIINLDNLPYSRHLLEMEKYDLKLDFLDLPATTIITSRGCPYHCYFCATNAAQGHSYTLRSASNVVDEIESCIEKYKIKGIKFFDATFTVNREHVLSIIKEMKERNIHLPWECELRVDTVDKPLLNSMQESGCYYVDFGVESIVEKILKTIDKQITPVQVTDTLKWCEELGIKTKVFFSFGHLGETLNDSLRTLEFIEKHINSISKLTISPMVKIYPGTDLEKSARENGLLPDDFSWSKPFYKVKGPLFSLIDVPILLQPNFGIKEIKKVNRRLQWIISYKKYSLKEYFTRYTFKNISSKVKLAGSLGNALVYAIDRILEIIKLVMLKVLKLGNR